MESLIIVAHPDDEVIWSGGLILQKPTWDWTIFSLCRAADPDRAPKFKKVCNSLKAKQIITNLDDDSDEPLPTESIKKIIIENLSNRKFDKVFTHGSNGEYGHIRHIDVHEAITELVKEKKLQCNELWYFAYTQSNIKSMHDQATLIPIADDKADLIITLTEKQHAKKLKLITEIYGFKPPIFETQAAGKIEAFNKHKN